MERSAEFLIDGLRAIVKWHGGDATGCNPQLLLDRITAILAAAEAREAGHPTAAEVIAAAEKALEKIEDIADGRLMRVQDRVADELALTDVANESRACLDVIVRYKEANHAK